MVRLARQSFQDANKEIYKETNTNLVVLPVFIKGSSVVLGFSFVNHHIQFNQLMALLQMRMTMPSFIEITAS